MKHHVLNFHQRRSAFGASLLITVLAFTALLHPVNAEAQDEWSWRASIYGWLPTIKGTTNFPTSGDGSDIEIDTDQILSSLDFTFMGTLKARRGSWGMFTDILYLDVGGTEKNSRNFTVGPGDLPVGVDGKLKLDLKSTVWTITGTYNLNSSDRHESDLLLGARLVDMKQTLSYEINADAGEIPLPERSGSSKASAKNWDAVIGVTGYAFVGDGSRWFIPYLFDVGTGDSDLTWQAMAGIGYKFGWGAMEVTYRHLDYNPGSNSPIDDLSFSGPLFGATFLW